MLTFVGIGPGDPSLITFAAAEAIQKADLVAFPITHEEGKSIAAEIASEFIRGKKTLPLIFPMVLEPTALKEAWHKASSELVTALKANSKVVFLSVGDISLYSTSSNIVSYLKANYPEVILKVIPGITSFSAASALAQIPLASKKEQLLISTVPNNKEDFTKILDEAFESERNIVFLKLGERWPWVRDVLEKRNLLEKTVFAQRIGFLDQEVAIAGNISAESKTYFSLLIIRHTL